MKITYLIKKIRAARNAVILTSTVFLALAVPQLSYATTISLVNNDGSGEGFNDPAAPFSGQTGNTGTTLGQQRLNVFAAAADYWEQRIVSSVTISVGINFDPLTCNSSGAVLGSAGPNSVFRDFAGAPLSSTWYVGAVTNSITGSDADTNASDISARFNSDIDNNNSCLNGTNWWYGIDSPAPGGTISLFDTVLHEIGHGLGVVSLVGQDGTKFLGFNDAYMAQLFDETTGLFWRNMSNAQRVASAINTGNLVWRGVNADSNSGHLNAGLTNGHIRMFAPNPFQAGSSVSHWDTALSPDELMEPSATLTSDDTSTIQLLKDVGWQIVEGPGELGFTASLFKVREGSGSARIKVERSVGNIGAVSVLVSSADGSATSGEDYNSINKTLTWADGEMGVKTATIAITDDMVTESSTGETVSLTLSNTTGGPSIIDNSSTLRILDPFVDDGFLLNVIPAIVAAIKKNPPKPAAPILPKWSVVNGLCCNSSSSRFSVTQGSSSLSATASSCPATAPQSGLVTSTAGSKSFRWAFRSSGCGDFGAGFNFTFREATEYVFVSDFDGNDLFVSIFSRPIAGLISSQKRTGDGDLTLLKRIRLSTDVNQQYESNSGLQAIK
ncbi:MAG: hypothetical protein ACI8RW_000097 [Porticoccaceae bacterium]|jgi:hypothetical protein